MSDQPALHDPRTTLRTLYAAAIEAALPGPAVRAAVAAHLPLPPRGRCVVVGAGHRPRWPPRWMPH
jgi:glycerate-2-kinase